MNALLEEPPPPAVDATTGRSYFQLLSFTDGSIAVRRAWDQGWKCHRAGGARLKSGSQAADFAGTQNSLRGF